MTQEESNAGSPKSEDSLASCGQMEEETEPDVRKLLKNSVTLGEFFRAYYATKLQQALLGRVPAIREAILKHFLRYYEPWPDWVLRMEAEVAGVYAPTIPKSLLYAFFKFIHTVVFEVRLDGTTPRELLSAPEIDANVLGAALGHGTVWQQVAEQKALELAQAGIISAENLLEIQTTAKPPEILKEALTRYVDARSINEFVAFSDALANARARTLDEQGRFRTTTATDVYSVILSDWPRVEAMTGPTELCKFLSGTLVGSRNQPALKLDRIKKICRRMQIKFKGGKGTSSSPALSL